MIRKKVGCILLRIIKLHILAFSTAEYLFNYFLPDIAKTRSVIERIEKSEATAPHSKLKHLTAAFVVVIRNFAVVIDVNRNFATPHRHSKRLHLRLPPFVVTKVEFGALI